MRTTLLPRNPRSPLGRSSEQTSGEWLTAEMEMRGFSNIKLYRALQQHGFQGTSPQIVSLWRTDKAPIGAETVPILLRALGLCRGEQQLWARHFMQQLHPGLTALALG